jgi:hypothetical protein
METVKTAVAELNDRQILVMFFEDGTLHIAERENSWDTWGRPVYTQFATMGESTKH